VNFNNKLNINNSTFKLILMAKTICAIGENCGDFSTMWLFVSYRGLTAVSRKDAKLIMRWTPRSSRGATRVPYQLKTARCFYVAAVKFREYTHPGSRLACVTRTKMKLRLMLSLALLIPQMVSAADSGKEPVGQVSEEERLIRAASHGDVLSQLKLGQYYEPVTWFGCFTFKQGDIAKAVKYYELAAKQQNAEAIKALGKLIQSLDHVLFDRVKALLWSLSEEGNPEAVRSLIPVYQGMILRNPVCQQAGIRHIKDLDPVHVIRTDTSTTDNEKAFWAMALAHELSDGSTKDSDIVWAQRTLAGFFRDGTGVGKSDKRYIHWLEKAARGQSPHEASIAANELAQCYFFGNFVPNDINKGVLYLRSAAENGGAAAALDLSTRYLTGNGVEKNEGLAAQWLSVAANRGSGHAMFLLAQNHEKGLGMEQDEITAYDLYGKAKEIYERDNRQEQEASKCSDKMAALEPIVASKLFGKLLDQMDLPGAAPYRRNLTPREKWAMDYCLKANKVNQEISNLRRRFHDLLAQEDERIFKSDKFKGDNDQDAAFNVGQTYLELARENGNYPKTHDLVKSLHWFLKSGKTVIFTPFFDICGSGLRPGNPQLIQPPISENNPYASEISEALNRASHDTLLLSGLAFRAEYLTDLPRGEERLKYLTEVTYKGVHYYSFGEENGKLASRIVEFLNQRNSFYADRDWKKFFASFLIDGSFDRTMKLYDRHCGEGYRANLRGKTTEFVIDE